MLVLVTDAVAVAAVVLRASDLRSGVILYWVVGDSGYEC